MLPTTVLVLASLVAKIFGDGGAVITGTVVAALVGAVDAPTVELGVAVAPPVSVVSFIGGIGTFASSGLAAASASCLAERSPASDAAEMEAFVITGMGLPGIAVAPSPAVTLISTTFGDELVLTFANRMLDLVRAEDALVADTRELEALREGRRGMSWERKNLELLEQFVASNCNQMRIDLCWVRLVEIEAIGFGYAFSEH